MNSKNPEIRFKGFTDAWEQRKLIDIVYRITTSSDKEDFPRVEYEDIISGEGQLNKDLFQKKSSKKGIMFQPGDILFGKLRPYLKNWLLSDFKGIAVGDFWVLRPHDSDEKFNYSLIQNNKFQTIANQSTGTKMPRSDWKVVSNTIFSIPLDTKEQTQIGDFFFQLDKTIALHQHELTLFKQRKKAFLKLLFPIIGESNPTIRFKGFTEKWIVYKLGEVTEMYQPQTISQSDLIEDGVPVFGANGYIGFYGESNHTSDQVTISARGENTGTPSYVKGPCWITGNSMVVNVDNNQNIYKYYIFQYLFNSSLKRFITGGAQPQLTRNVLDKVPIQLPTIKEQIKIGNFFKQLDDSITLQEQKLESLKQMKKAFLQKMFV